MPPVISTVGMSWMLPWSRPPPGLALRTMFVRELVDGQDIEQVLLVRERELRSNGDGEYLRLTLGDRTGAVVALVREHVSELAPVCEAGTPVAVAGRYAVHPRYGPELTRALAAGGRGARVRPRPTCSTARRGRSATWSRRCAT